MVQETTVEDKESKTNESSKSSEENDETSKTDENSEKAETSETNPNKQQSEVESGDETEKPDEENSSESSKNSESSTVEDSKPEEGAATNDDDDEAQSVEDEIGSKSDSKNGQNVEELSNEEKTESDDGSENIEESEPDDAENVEADAENAEADTENAEADDNQEASAPDNQEASELPPENGTSENKEYTFDEMVDIAGYGRFQRTLTFLAGLGWMADAFEIRVLSMLGDFIACDWTLYRWHTAALTSMVFIGMLFGAPCFGIIADNYGRRKSLAIALLLLFIFGASSAASPNIQILLVMRCITGFVFGGATQGFTLCAEYYPTKNRGIAGFYLRYYWAAGTIILIMVTWLVMEHTRNWHWLVVGAATPSLIVFFSMNWFPESVRWYLVSGKYEKAVEQLSKMLTTNGSELEATQLKRIPDEEREEQGNLLHLMRSPFTKTTLLLWYISFATSFHYYGITLMAPYVINEGKLMVPANEKDRRPVINISTPAGFFMNVMDCRQPTPTNYIDLMWHSCAEFPGLIVFTLVVRHMERRTLLSVSCMINAFIVLLLLAEAKTTIPTKIVLFIARANCIGFLQLVIIISSETFPTTLRATGVGSVAAFAKLGGAMVPFIAQVLIIEDPISTVCILGAVILMGAAAGAYLPRDTKGVPLKELTEEQIQADKQKKEDDKEV